MAYFTQDYINFFKDLEKNNNRDWFLQNKGRYENSVKKPFHAFVNQLIGAISDVEEPVPMESKDAVFRINRDIRFSNDKTPYKIHMAAIISKHGRKDHAHPAFYIQANHVDLRLYSGAYGLDREQLARVRNFIAANSSRFETLLNDKKFVSHFGEVLGEKNKRLPKDLKEAAEKQPLIFNKSFYFFKSFPSTLLLSEGVIDSLMESYSICKPIRSFINQGIDS